MRTERRERDTGIGFDGFYLFSHPVFGTLPLLFSSSYFLVMEPTNKKCHRKCCLPCWVFFFVLFFCSLVILGGKVTGGNHTHTHTHITFTHNFIHRATCFLTTFHTHNFLYFF
ncbi:hypothetical protein QBC43DRAFT_132706 [Cladorrhinum sp. PSN259]|nr:hypothetical protein QBC43DRAFT_132706 [Cladorrhinum sp. PSN259]